MELSLPAVQALRSEASVVDPILGSAANPDHAAILDGNVEPTAVAAQQTGRRNPRIDVLGRQAISQMQIDAYGPGLAWRIGRPLSPNIVAGTCRHASGVPA
jgi:hypothetical protein